MRERLTTGKAIEILSGLNPDLPLKHRLGDPHSNRGDYYELGIDYVEYDEPVASTVAELIDLLRSTIGATYKNSKDGNDYRMDERTYVNLSTRGNQGVPLTDDALMALIVKPVMVWVAFGDVIRDGNYGSQPFTRTFVAIGATEQAALKAARAVDAEYRRNNCGRYYGSIRAVPYIVTTDE
jgi:hypothetical protein